MSSLLPETCIACDAKPELIVWLDGTPLVGACKPDHLAAFMKATKHLGDRRTVWTYSEHH